MEKVTKYVFLYTIRRVIMMRLKIDYFKQR